MFLSELCFHLMLFVRINKDSPVKKDKPPPPHGLFDPPLVGQRKTQAEEAGNFREAALACCPQGLVLVMCAKS